MTNRSVASEVIRLVRRFESDVPRVAKATVEEIWRIPGYSSIDDTALRSEVEDAVTTNIKAYLRALSEGKDLAKRDIDDLAIVGRQRAHQGVPIEDVLKAFRMVGRVLWDHLTEVLTGDEAPPMEVAIQLSGSLMKFTDQISSAVAQQYSNAQRTIVRRQEASQREFLNDLLQGTFGSPDAMFRRCREFGYDPARPQLVVVATSVGADAAEEQHSLAKALDGLAEEVRSSGRPMVDRRGGQNIGLLALSAGSEAAPSYVAEFLISELGEGWRLGVGGPYPGLEGCRQSYIEACEAIEIGSVLDEERRAYVFEQYLLYRFLRADPALVGRFVSAVLGPLIEHDERRRSELVKTLDAYFACDASAKEAGSRLYAHPHTVSYRLKQVERLTGRSLRDPEDKLHLHLAVKALRLMNGSTETEPDSAQGLDES
jgi:sugar diacid utilization regulator